MYYLSCCWLSGCFFYVFFNSCIMKMILYSIGLYIFISHIIFSVLLSLLLFDQYFLC
jgi:hypothetical protein